MKRSTTRGPRPDMDGVTCPLMLALTLMVLPGALVAQSGVDGSVAPESSYRDATARRLHESAMEARERFDASVLSYTAVVRQRISASLRMPLKDRTLYRSEAAHRLWWKRDGENLVQVLAFREQTPAGVDMEDIELDRFDSSFDPMNDKLFFGLAENDEDEGGPDEDDFWFEHPLYRDWVDSYWFSAGDTISISLPDGRQVRSIELQVVPRQADVHRMTGSLWIEPEEGHLTRAVYRLSDQFDAFRDIADLQEEEDEGLRRIPGMLKPWTFDLKMIAVDYGLWDFEVWMPRSMRMDGLAGAGIIKFPVTMDYSYGVEDVSTERSMAAGDADNLPEMHFEKRSEAMAYLNQLAFGEDVDYEMRRGAGGDDGRAHIMVPTDRAFLGSSPELPPPIWEEAAGFTSEVELRQMFDDLADLPGAPTADVPVTLRWGLQRPDLSRFNRVEGLSLGIRGQIRPTTVMGPLSLTGTARIGLGDLEPNLRADMTHEGLRRRISLSGYSELAAIDAGARHLGLGNSLLAALFGRDDGDYFYRSGASLEWLPPSAARRTYRVRTYAEYQRPASVATEFAVFQFWKEGWAYRPNIAADEGWEYGAVLDVNPWWGSDPLLTQGGFDLMVQGGTGMADYARASLTGRIVVPFPSALRVAVEAGGGTSWGDPTVQRLWFVGGSRTLRGYGPRIAGGADYTRGRIEIARTFVWGALSLFSDYGWAGTWDGFEVSNGYTSAGVGLSILDGLIRMDAAQGLKDPMGFRFEFYLDGIL